MSRKSRVSIIVGNISPFLISGEHVKKEALKARSLLAVLAITIEVLTTISSMTRLLIA